MQIQYRSSGRFDEKCVERLIRTGTLFGIVSLVPITLSVVLYLAHGAARAVTIWVASLPTEMHLPATIIGLAAWLLSLLSLARRRSAR